MDIDAIIEELDKLVHYRGDGGFAEAIPRAQKLLRQPRYQGADDDPHELLARDIKAAIARLPTKPGKRLPKGLQAEANGLLRINMPEQHIINRLRLLGKGGYSTDAQQWHRKAVLGRVAGELIKRWDAPSYRILDLDINVRQTSYTVPVGVGPTTYIRNVEFRWKVVSLVSDLRWFAFYFPTPQRLKYHQLVGGTEGYGYDSVLRTPVVGSPDTHWYLLCLSEPLPFGVPVKLHARLVFHKASKGNPQLDYVPTVPIKSLSLSFTGGEGGQCTCVELDDKADQVLRKFKAKTTTKTTEHGEDGFIEYIEQHTLDRFRVRSPQVGRCYRLAWPNGKIL